jgi:hypothetical protein
MSTSNRKCSMIRLKLMMKARGIPHSEGMAVVEKRLRGSFQYLVLLIAGREHISVKRA